MRASLNHHFSRLTRVALAWLGALLPACAEESEAPSLVKDLRVLAVASDPPEVLFDRHTGFEPGQVMFTALVADPGGTVTTFTWRFCPVESDQACMNFPALRESAPAPLRPMLDGLFQQREEGPAILDPQAGPGAVKLNGFPAAWPTDLFNYHLQASGLGLGNGAWPSAVLSVRDANGAEVLAQKRVTLNALDLAQFNPELGGAFGFQVCVPEAPAPGCLPLRPRVPNRNPAIAGLAVARGKAADLPFEPVTEPLIVRVGETVRLRPTLSAEAFESYQQVQSALQDSSLRVEEQKERPVISWFSTTGSFANDLTAFEATKTFDNTFTAPELLPAAPGGEASLWLVARDLRGGVGWRHVKVKIVP